MDRRMSVEDMCMKLKPVFGEKIDDIYLRYSIAETLEEKNEIEQLLNLLYYKNLSKLLEKKVLLEPPKQEDVVGDYPLAMVSYAGKKLFPFALREQDWPRHVCVTGMSGSGKTTLGFHILENFIKKEKPFLIFDWKKSFRPLTLVSPDLMCFTIGKESVSNFFKTNINQPPKGISPKEWINVLCDLLTESFFVSYGVHKVLLETLDEAFKEWGIYTGSENYPTWNHIKWRLEEKMNKVKGREVGWIESALRIATVVTFGDFGKVCNYKGDDSFSVEELLDKKIIFELNSLGNIEKKFFCEFILTYLYKLRKAKESFDHSFSHAILVDEAHNIFLKEGTHFSKESVTDMIYREMREYGTSLICFDQHVSKLSDTVNGNSACHIAFQQQLPQDIWDISGIMQLKEKKEFFSMLPVGTAIVKLSERYNSPFLVEVMPVPLMEKEITDANIQDRMKAILMGRDYDLGIDPEFNKDLISGGKKDILKDTSKGEENLGEEDKVKIEKKQEDKTNLPKPLFKLEDFLGKNISKIIPNVEDVVDTEKSKGLTSVQQVLYDFVMRKSKEGVSLLELERIMDRNVQYGDYSAFDVLKVINYALENQLTSPELVTILEKQKIYKPEDYNLDNTLSKEQEMFLSFLQEHPAHGCNTTELYKLIGLSPRKGNKIKEELLKKNLITIEEQKNEKGWRKVINLK